MLLTLPDFGGASVQALTGSDSNNNIDLSLSSWSLSAKEVSLTIATGGVNKYTQVNIQLGAANGLSLTLPAEGLAGAAWAATADSITVKVSGSVATDAPEPVETVTPTVVRKGSFSGTSLAFSPVEAMAGTNTADVVVSFKYSEDLQVRHPRAASYRVASIPRVPPPAARMPYPTAPAEL